MTEPVYLVDACRTPVGTIGGALSRLQAGELTAAVIRALLDRTPQLDVSAIDDIAWAAGSQAAGNLNSARSGCLLAGLLPETAQTNVSRLRGSGLQAVIAAAHTIAAGEADVCIAGATDSPSHAPLVLACAEHGELASEESVGDWQWPRGSALIEEPYPPNSITRCQEAEALAARCGIPRERQDVFAGRSLRLARAAQQARRFEDEVIAMPALGNLLAIDEAMMTTGDGDGRSPAVALVHPDGTVTSGNSSWSGDGATAMLLMSQRALVRHQAVPVARYVASAVAGMKPAGPRMGAVGASLKAASRAGIELEELSLVESDEAFAVETIGVIDELDLDEDLVNVNGGAIALGHPTNSAGPRMLTTLLHELRRRRGCYGLVTMPVGAGQGVALVVQAVRNEHG